MENDTPTNSGYMEVKLSHSNDVAAGGVERDISVNSGAHPQKKEASKEDYETGLDEEFIKVEKEVGDVKEISTPHKPIEVEETTSNAVTSLKVLEAEDKIKSLELQLETVSKELQHSESEKAMLKSKVDMANEKLETVRRHCKELELDQKRMKEEISAVEQKYNIQLASHQEALGALDVKHKEVGDLKESFNGVSVELENSRKKLEELEAALASSASVTRKLEELSNEKSLHAEAESKRASELENMLELAKARTRDMEDQIGNLQEEMKGLYNKVSENLQVEEALNHSTLELSAAQEKLKLAESQISELEEKFASKENVIQELTRELDLHKSSQERMKEELLSLENLLSSYENNMQSKILTLEEVELKLQQEIKTREDAEIRLTNQEVQMISLQEELKKLIGEKGDLLSSVADLNTNLSLTKELCSQLEDKFLVADQNFSKTDSLLSQALSYNAELEQKLKSLEELHSESRMVAETASERNLELESLIQSSIAAEEVLKEQLREKEVKLISAEQKNVELEEQIARTELKFSDAEREIKALSEKISELTVVLSNFEEERELSKGQLQEYQNRISQLESSLNEADSRNSELVQELKDLAEMRDMHEGRAAAAHQRSLELEDLVQLSHSKAEDADRKVEDLGLLLEKERQQAQNLVQLVNIAEAKCRDAEAESKQYSSRVSELYTELEAFKTKSESLEIAVQVANEKEKELTDKLNEITEERKKFEELSNISSEKLLQAENLIEVLQREMKSAQENLVIIEGDLKASGVRENDILEKLKSAEEQLEHQGRAAEQSSARCLELESVHESLRKESELKLQEAINNFTLKDSEAKQFQEKIMILEDQVANHQREAVEASEKVASLTAEMEVTAGNIDALEKTIEELKGKLSDSEMKLEQSFSENELLGGTNSQLRSELEELGLLLEKERQQAQILEQLVNIAEAKYRDSEAESKQYSSRVSELYAEVEAFKTKSESLEIAVQVANEKEKELTDKLNDITEERKKFEELSNISSEKLLQAENLIEVLQREMKSAQENLVIIEEDLKASGVRENDILEKLKSAEEQLEHQGRVAEQVSARCLELESVHESLQKESELKLQEAVNNFTLKDSEAKQFQEKIMILEEQVANHQREAVEASEKVASLTAEMEVTAVNIDALEKTIEELKGKLSDSEMKLEQSFSESELLAGTNSQLRSELETHQNKVNELNNLLSSIYAEKEATAEQLASHVKTIEELANEHSRGLELNSITESRIKETELQLNEALEKFTQRDSEASKLNEKLVALESQLKMYEEQLGEVTVTAENRKVELEEALLKMQKLETFLEEVQGRGNQLETENKGLAQASMVQTEQLAAYETKMNDLEMSLKVVNADKEDVVLQLHSSKKTIEDLKQQHASNAEKLQSQLCTVMEENNMLNEMYQKAKEELQVVMVQLEEQKAREISINAEMQNLKSEITSMKLAASEQEIAGASRMEEYSNIVSEKDALDEQLKQLQVELSLAHSTIAEQRELESRMEHERDAAAKLSLGEIEAERQRAILLENEAEELKQHLQLVETQYKEKVAQESRKVDLLNVELDDLKHKQSQNVELEKKIAQLEDKLERAKSSKKAKSVHVEVGSKAEPEVKSRDLGFDITPPPTLKSTKGGEGPHQATDMGPVSPPSGLMAFKFILGVALVSVIIGIILGKKY